MTKPLILVSNDDGIHAPGIKALASAVEGLGEVVVIAPDRDQSAVSHKLSLHEPIRAKQVAPNRWAVGGTPTDCVYLGFHELLDRKPDLVLSGVNFGPNLGTDVHYSGTVAAAVEATLLGGSGIAVSCASKREPNFDHAAAFVRELAAWVLAQGGLPAGTTLNVNVPKGAPTQFQYTFLGHRPYDHSVDKRTDPRGNTYYWIGGNPQPHEDEPGTDSSAIRAGLIAVTPMMLDTTEYAAVADAPTLSGFESTSSIDPPDNYKLGTLY